MRVAWHTAVTLSVQTARSFGESAPQHHAVTLEVLETLLALVG